VDLVQPESAEETTRVAAACASDGIDVVFAAGGDGTAAAVARGLVSTRTAMGVLPLGTANDLARALGIWRGAVVDGAKRLGDAVRTIDVVAVGDAVFCTVGGLGIVSDSAMAAARLKSGTGLASRAARALGGGIYRATGLAALATRRPLATRYEIEAISADGLRHDLELDSPGLFVANQRFCGGGLALPSVAADDDGLCELLVVRDVSRARLVDAFARLTLRAPIPDTTLAVVRARSARIRCARPESFLGDGDSLGVSREFELRVMPRALRVLV
jgi:diacylglycerol kinase (ATP)